MVVTPATQNRNPEPPGLPLLSLCNQRSPSSVASSCASVLKLPLVAWPRLPPGPGPHSVLPGILTSFTCQPFVFMCITHTAILSFLKELSVCFLPIAFQLLQWFSGGFRMKFKFLNLLSRFSPSKFRSIWPPTASLASRQAIVCLSSPAGHAPLTDHVDFLLFPDILPTFVIFCLHRCSSFCVECLSLSSGVFNSYSSFTVSL